MNLPPCIASLIHLCFTGRFLSRHQRSAVSNAINIAVLFRVAPGCLGRGVLFCWLSGWLLSTEATSSNLAAGAKSVLAVCPRCCRCHSAPQQPSIVAVRKFKSWLRAPRAIRRRWKRSRCQFSSSQAALYQVLRIRFECAGTYLSTPTIVVRICDDNIFYKAGI